MYIFIYKFTYISTTFGSHSSCFWGLKPVFHDKGGTLYGRHSCILCSDGTLDKTHLPKKKKNTDRQLTTGTFKPCICWSFCSPHKYFRECGNFASGNIFNSQRLNLNSQSKTQKKIGSLCNLTLDSGCPLFNGLSGRLLGVLPGSEAGRSA